MGYTIRNISVNELKSIYNRIKSDFARGEYPPYDVLYQQLQNGTQKGMILLEGGSEIAYCICAEGHTNNYVLISLLAVFEEFRGSGFGSAFLKELTKIYSLKRGMIVEVEKPENAVNDKEKVIREKRIRFYQNAGFSMISDIEYSIWDVPMHLMVFPQGGSKPATNNEIGRVVYEIYLELMGERYIHKLKFQTLNNSQVGAVAAISDQPAQKSYLTR